MDHHAGGLVDDGEVRVFVEDIEGDVFGGGVQGRGLWGAFDLDGFAAAEFLLGFGRVAVDSDLPGFDEELDAATRDVGKGLGEIPVETEIGSGRIGGEGADACAGVFFQVVEVDHGNWRREGLFDAAVGAVLGLDGVAALALGKHVLRRHG